MIMKNRHFFSLFLIGFAVIFLSNCSFIEISESNKLPCPDLNTSDSGIVITLKNSINDIQYVNIYRQEITGFSDPEQSNFPKESIGIVFPVKKNTTFVFEDTMIYKGHKYRYCARTFDKTNGYSETLWTEGIVAKNGANKELTSIFSYGITNGTKFLYNEIDKKIVIKGTINNPVSIDDYESKFVPALIVSNSKSTQTFELESIADGTQIYLSSILPGDFFNTDITILGLVGQRKEEIATDNDGLIKVTQRIIWTQKADFTLIDSKSGLPISDNKIMLSEQHGETGYDYSMPEA